MTRAGSVASCRRNAYGMHARCIRLQAGCMRLQACVHTLQARDAQDEAPIYVVQLDSGGLAEDVCGSEVRAFGTGRRRRAQHAAERAAGGGGASSCTSESLTTCHDNLSNFEYEQRSEASSSEVSSVDEARRMGCRVTSEGVEVKFIEEEEPAWAPPTIALLRAHTIATRAQSK
jgi:hypothetical protein